jgi:hypothetical protein
MINIPVFFLGKNILYLTFELLQMCHKKGSIGHTSFDPYLNLTEFAHAGAHRKMVNAEIL